MKNVVVVVFILFHLGLSMSCLCQQIPDDIKTTLDKLKAETKIGLDDFRTNRQSRGFHIGLIQMAFTEEEFRKVELLGLKFHIGDLYDEDMRIRLLQLLKNEYRSDELDTLANRIVSMGIEGYKRKVLEISKLDTMVLFQKTIDSIYIEEVKAQPKSHLYPHHYAYKALITLKLDTLKIFTDKLDSLCKEAKGAAVYNYLHDNYTDLSSIAELCGYLNDQRYIQPLIEALDKPNFQKYKVKEALARMKVEPYFSTLLKENTHTIDEILAGISVDITLFADVMRTQESFLELSKYLKSNIECGVIADEDNHIRRHGDELKFCVFQTIYNNIDNTDLKKLVGNGADKIYVPYEINTEFDVAVEKLYDWMQRNYGMYRFSWYHY